MFLVGTRLTTTGDVASARRALDDFPELIKDSPGGAGDPRGATGAGDVSAVIGWPVYLDVIEDVSPMLFKLSRRGWSTTIAHIFNSLPGVSPFACSRESLRQPNQWRRSAAVTRGQIQERPDDTFAMAELSWVTSPRHAMPMRCAFLDKRRIQSRSKRMLWPAQISRSGSRKSRHVRAHLRKPLRGFDDCSPPAGGVASIAALNIDPVWDPIRNRPDFQQLLSGPEQIGPNK